MNTEVQNLSLFCIGSALLWITLDGSFVRYVKPAMGPYLLVSAAVILVLSVVSMARHVQLAGPGAGELCDDDHGHTHRSTLLWLLVLPVLVLFFVKPPALAPTGGTDVSNASVAHASAGGAVRFPPLPPGDPPRLGIYEIVQRATQPDGGGLTGRPIAVIGTLQVSAGKTELAQVTIICCAADARTFRIGLTGPPAWRLAGSPPGTWWQVIGVVVDGSANEDRDHVPLLEVVDVRAMPEPENPYSY